MADNMQKSTTPTDPLSNLPGEIINGVMELVALSARDCVALDKAYEGEPFANRYSINWKLLAFERVDKLLAIPQLCKKIRYIDNDKQQWDRMTMRPAAWTRIPPTYTYLQMLRSWRKCPNRDLDGKRITHKDIEKFYELEQIEKGRGLVFQTRVAREGGGHPSPESREKMGMDDEDAREYPQLLKDAVSPLEIKLIQECYEDDDIKRQETVGQREAFRNFFYDLVYQADFRPAVCVDCLAEDTVIVTVTGERGGRRYCEDCLIRFSKVMGDAVVDADTLAAFKIKVPVFGNHDSTFVDPFRFRTKTYLLTSDANKLSELYHGMSYHDLLDAGFSPEVIAANASRHKYASKIISKILDLHRHHEFWSKLEIDSTSLAFWARVSQWARIHLTGIEEDSDIPASVSDHDVIQGDIIHFWNLVLRDDFGRVPLDVAKKYGVVRVNELAALTSPQQHPLDAGSMTAAEFNRLRTIIYGNQVTSADGLSMHFVYSAAFLKIVKTFGISTIELIADILAIVYSRSSATLPSTRDQRLRFFVDQYYQFMRSQHPFLGNLKPKSLSKVPAEVANDLGLMFLNHVTHDGFLQRALHWSQGKSLIIDLPLHHNDLVMGRATEFVARFVWDSNTVVLPHEPFATLTDQECGRISWINVIVDPETLYLG